MITEKMVSASDRRTTTQHIARQSDVRIYGSSHSGSLALGAALVLGGMATCVE